MQGHMIQTGITHRTRAKEQKNYHPIAHGNEVLKSAHEDLAKFNSPFFTPNEFQHISPKDLKKLTDNSNYELIPFKATEVKNFDWPNSTLAMKHSLLKIDKPKLPPLNKKALAS